jgi:hypothetical protein
LAEATPQQVAQLAADVIELNNKNESDYYHHDDNNQTGHGLKKQAVAAALNALRAHGMVRDGYPNYEKFGFESQAFIDVTLDLQDDRTSEKEIRKSITDDPSVILIYTVFGEVDLRCKVVGFNAREIEKTAMKIKAIKGVSSSKTFMIIDETDDKTWRKRAASLIRQNATRVGEVVQRKRKAQNQDDN